MENASFCAKTPFSPMKNMVFPLKKACFRGRMPYFGGVFWGWLNRSPLFRGPNGCEEEGEQKETECRVHEAHDARRGACGSRRRQGHSAHGSHQEAVAVHQAERSPGQEESAHDQCRR